MSKAKMMFGPNDVRDAKLSEIYDLESVNEAIIIAENQRGGVQAMNGDPKSVARYNVWTEVKTHLEKLKKEMENES